MGPIFLQIKAQDEPTNEDEANVHLSSSSPSPTNEKLTNHIEDHDNDDLILPLKKDEDMEALPNKKEERVTKNVSDVESVSDEDEDDEGIDIQLEGRMMSEGGQQVSFSLFDCQYVV